MTEQIDIHQYSICNLQFSITDRTGFTLRCSPLAQVRLKHIPYQRYYNDKKIETLMFPFCPDKKILMQIIKWAFSGYTGYRRSGS